MPRDAKRDREEARALINWLMEELGVDSIPDLARRIGFAPGDEERYLYRWRAKKGSPSVSYTMRMLRGAGVLREATNGASPSESVTKRRDRALLAAVEAMIDRVVEMRRLLLGEPEDPEQALEG